MIVAVIGILQQLNIDLGHAFSSTSVVKVSSLAVDLNTAELFVEPSIKSLALHFGGIDDSLSLLGCDFLVMELLIDQAVHNKGACQ